MTAQTTDSALRPERCGLPSRKVMPLSIGGLRGPDSIEPWAARYLDAAVGGVALSRGHRQDCLARFRDAPIPNLSPNTSDGHIVLGDGVVKSADGHGDGGSDPTVRHRDPRGPCRDASEDCARFEAEFRAAIAGAADDLDLSTVEAALARWHALATMAANPLTPEERAQLQCAKVGDFTGLCTRDESGNWVRLSMPRYEPIWLRLVTGL